MSDRIRRSEQELYDLLGPRLREITSVVGDAADYHVNIPDPSAMDKPVEELASLVAKTSNTYFRAAHFAGMARAEFKLAKGRYERKYKKSRLGKNDAERDRSAMEACEDEHLAMTLFESISGLADSLEHAARVASESSRKIYDKVAAMNAAEHRQGHGTLRENDFTPY